ncbi:hypothetical protein M0805_000798 [Coniferiporia weirii]|nr:hypothetical protein M0805_000798 [Coniferiporia weirii]
MSSTALDAHDGDTALKVGAMLAVFILSLFASTFPTLSRRISFLRIHHIVFFILKHFGTGVILATAFVHLLQDAFETLLSLPADYDVRHWVGLLVLASLLAIFLVEYVSMTYVERLEGTDDLESHGHHHHLPQCDSPSSSHSEQHDEPRKPHVHNHKKHHNHTRCAHTPSSSTSEVEDTDFGANGTGPEEDTLIRTPGERTSLLHSVSAPGAPHPHLHQHKHTHRESHSHPASATYGTTDANVAKGAVPFFAGHHRYEQPGAHAAHSAPSARARRTPALLNEALLSTVAEADDHLPVTVRLDAPVRGHDHHQQQHAHISHPHRGNQELVHDHESGEVWECHVDEHSEHDGCEQDGTEEEGDTCNENFEDRKHDVGKRRQIINTLVLQTGIMVHSLVIGLTLSIKSGPEFTSLFIAILFHQLFEGLSLGVRLAALAVSADAPARAHALAALFAAAVPAGGLIGRLTLTHTGSATTLQLTQGLMSALSAGTLVYAACVELLAADFVADPQLKRAPVARQALAVGSLLAGVAMMAALA